MKSTLPLLAALLFAVIAYAGSYVGIVKSSEVAYYVCGDDPEPLAIGPAFREDGLVGFFFAPIHAVDQKLRPKYWALNPMGLERRNASAP